MAGASASPDATGRASALVWSTQLGTRKLIAAHAFASTQSSHIVGARFVEAPSCRACAIPGQPGPRAIMMRGCGVGRWSSPMSSSSSFTAAGR